MQIITPDTIDSFGNLGTFSVVVLFLCIVAVAALVMTWWQGRTFKSLVDTLKATNDHLSNSMFTQQKSSDNREDKLAAAVTMQAQEASKIARALMLINENVNGSRNTVEETGGAIIDYIDDVVNRYSAAAGEIQKTITEGNKAVTNALDLLGKQLEREALELRKIINNIPGEQEERGKRLDAIIGHLEMLMPKLNKLQTGTFTKAETNSTN